VSLLLEEDVPLLRGRDDETVDANVSGRVGGGLVRVVVVDVAWRDGPGVVQAPVVPFCESIGGWSFFYSLCEYYPGLYDGVCGVDGCCLAGSDFHEIWMSTS